MSRPEVVEQRKLHLLSKHGVECKSSKDWLHRIRRWKICSPVIARQSDTYKRVYEDLENFLHSQNTTKHAMRDFLQNIPDQRNLNDITSSIDYWSVHKHYCDDQ